MNDNWWVMQQMIEARERELRLTVERMRPWTSEGEPRSAGLIRGLRKRIGALLLAWGGALAADEGREGALAADQAAEMLRVPAGSPAPGTPP